MLPRKTQLRNTKLATAGMECCHCSFASPLWDEFTLVRFPDRERVELRELDIRMVDLD